MRTSYKVLIGIIAVIALMVLLAFILPGSSDSVANTGNMSAFMADDYEEYLSKNGYSGVMARSEVLVDITNYETDEEMVATLENDGVVTDEKGSITFKVDVAEEGFYNIKIDYYPVKGTNANPQRALKIDGEQYFKGMSQVVFPRIWNNSDTIGIESKNGNEIRPSAVEEYMWLSTYVSDSQRRDQEPYKFYFTQGEHTITFESVKEPLKIGKITLTAAKPPVSYEEYINKHKDAKVYDGVNLVYQAERTDENMTLAIQKSSTNVGVTSDYSSPYTVPYHTYKIMLNTMGGSNWRTPGTFITWKINVPEDGLYRLSFRGRQNTNRGVKSYRELRINGEVPFEEAKKIGFAFSGEFQNYIISKDNEPLLFYFNKGENTISLEVVLGDFANALTQVEDSIFALNDLYRRIVQITGVVPDQYIDYEIAKKIPDFAEIMENEANRLTAVADEVVQITGEKGQLTVTLEKMAMQAKELAEDPEKVIKQISQLNSNVSSLGTWILSIYEMPLEIDSFTLSSPQAKLKPAEPNVFIKMYNELIRFLVTFFVDESQISDVNEVGKDAIVVWMPSGRDQAQIVRNLIDESYTPITGKPVNLQLIPADVILPATLAGNGPDVVLNMGQSTIVNFAQRNALVDFSKLDGFEEVASRFYPSAIDAMRFKDGVYGLPEQQSFMMMFYRQDILDQLGLSVPKTWDDVRKMIPTLHINNYDFYIPTTGLYSTLVFQNGGNLYKGEGADYGIETALYDEEAMVAFKELTEFFTTHKLPVSADFTNRFRTGEIPIGIANYTTYNTLEVFAPEIRGLWSFAPVPGTVRKDGTFSNVVVSDTVGCIMLEQCENKQDAWDFIKWWLDADTQTRFANTLEAIMGSGARYATANKEVLQQLPWPARHAEMILQQFENTVGVPEVPGGYMTGRMLDYAFKAVVTDGQNPREALYLNLKDVQKELTKKRKEFNMNYVEQEAR